MIFYNMDMISIYVIKSPGQTSGPLDVETQERCVPNLNKEYIGHGAMIRICTLVMTSSMAEMAWIKNCQLAI